MRAILKAIQRPSKLGGAIYSMAVMGEAVIIDSVASSRQRIPAAKIFRWEAFDFSVGGSVFHKNKASWGGAINSEVISDHKQIDV